MAEKEIKYGFLRGKQVHVRRGVAASQAFKNLSGKFVKLDSSEYLDIADSGDTVLFGWAEVGEITSSSTAGQDVLVVNISLDAIYRIPADAAVTENLVGKSCDLIVASNIQKADIGESTEDVIIIVAVDAIDIANQTVQVRLNPATIIVSGVV